MVMNASRQPLHSAVGWPSTIIEEWDREQLRVAGLDPKQVPTEPYHIIRAPEICERYGWSLATLYRRMKHDEFPRPIPIGPVRRKLERECAA
jgi:predicted DNA-binding transcriptional regulator AlpA